MIAKRLFYGLLAFLCILFQLFRLACFVMFAIFEADCTLYHDSSSVVCKNFTVYDVPMCDGYCWKTLWLTCSILTSFFCICLLNQFVLPELRPVGCTVVLKCLICKPYFWSFNITTVVVIAYDGLIMKQNQDARIPIEIFVIVSKVFTLYLIYQLNFTYPPSKTKGFSFTSRALYFITLLIFVLDNLCKALAVSAAVAFKVYTVNPTAPKPLTIIDLMLMVINASLYYSFLQFYWLKLFIGDKNILSMYKQNLADTSGVREHCIPDEDLDGGEGGSGPPPPHPQT